MSQALRYDEVYTRRWPAPVERPLAYFGGLAWRLSSRREALARESATRHETGLRAGIAFEVRNCDNLPTEIIAAVERVAEFENYEPNWDGYGARPLDDATVTPAFDLIIDGFVKGISAFVVPLPSGGLGLRFDHAHKELSIDIHPGPFFEGRRLSNDEVEAELPEGSDFEAASEFFDQL